MSAIVGDPVVLRGEVTRVDGDEVTVKISGSDHPLTLRSVFVEAIERRPAERRPSAQMGDLAQPRSTGCR